MSVSQPTIKAELLVIFTAMHAAEFTDEEYADQLATVIYNAITSGQVDAGIAVQTNPVSGAGATTGTGVIS